MSHTMPARSLPVERTDSVGRSNYVASRPQSTKGGEIHVRWPSEAVGTETPAVDGFGEPSYDINFPHDANAVSLVISH